MAIVSGADLRGALAAVARRPDLWGVALVSAWRLVPRAWWRRRPFLPLPDAGWLAFRLETAYGTSRGALPPGDLVAYLVWCRREAARRRR